MNFLISGIIVKITIVLTVFIIMRFILWRWHNSGYSRNYEYCYQKWWHELIAAGCAGSQLTNGTAKRHR